MTAYVIRGIDPAPFVTLYGLDDAALAERRVVRMTADAKPGFPCRVTLEDVAPGEQVLLLNYELNRAIPRTAHAMRSSSAKGRGGPPASRMKSPNSSPFDCFRSAHSTVTT